MISDERIQQTVRTGEKNKETAVLVHNWCGHARVKRMPGRGMIEEIYKVPIGHMGMECAHAPAGGSFCWELADAALQFHDANCVGCVHRKPVNLPNLSQLVAERDAKRAAKKLENDRLDREEEDALAQREAKRALVRAALDPVAATNLDLLSELDKDGDRAIADKLAEVASLAPETFPAPLVEYLFTALDQRIARLQEAALLVLARLPGIDGARLVNAALDVVARNSGGPPAAHIIETYAEFADPAHIEPAVPNLVSVATPGHEPFFHHKTLIEEPLLSVYRHRPDAVRSGLKRLLERTEAFPAGLGARGLVLLIDHDPKLAGFMTDALLAKLARAKYLLQGDDDGVKGTLTDIRDVAVLAFHAAPEAVDTSIQQYLPAPLHKASTNFTSSIVRCCMAGAAIGKTCSSPRHIASPSPDWSVRPPSMAKMMTRTGSPPPPT